MNTVSTIEEKIQKGELELFVDTLSENVQPFMEVKKRPQDGVLLRVSGPFGEVDRENKNRRYYSRKLWEAVLSSDDIKEKIKNRGCFGEATHPTTFNAEFPRVSHVITDLYLNKDDGQLYGSADILDTPAGRIMDVLYRAKCRVGISSRGAGSTVKRNGREEISVRDFKFAGFDFVTDPSAHNAFPEVEETFKQEMRKVLSESADEILETEESRKYFCTLLEKVGCTDEHYLGQCGLSTLSAETSCPCEESNETENNSLIPMDKRLKELRGDKKEHKSEDGALRENLTSQLELKTQELADTTARLAGARQRLVDLEASLREACLKSQTTTSEIEGLQEEVEVLQSENSGLKEENSELISRIESFSKEGASSDTTKENLEMLVSTLTEEQEEQASALRTVQDENNQLQEELDQLREERAQNREELLSLKSKVVCMQTESARTYVRYVAASFGLDEKDFLSRVSKGGLKTRDKIRALGEDLRVQKEREGNPLGPLPTFKKEKFVKAELSESETSTSNKKRLGKIIRGA